MNITPQQFRRIVVACAAAAMMFASMAQALEKPINIRTLPLTPTPIELKVEDLPPPRPEEAARVTSRLVPPPENAALYAPQGFKVNVFAQGIRHARWLALTPEGDVLCAASMSNTIYLLKDQDNDGIADDAIVFLDKARGANAPFGMAFHEGYFYLGNTDAVLRYEYDASTQQLKGEPVKLIDLPGGGYNQHWTRNVRVAPNGKRLFVTIGSKSNNSIEPLPRAAVITMNLDGSDVKVYASGLRNPVGLDFHPVTHEPYVTVNERDNLGHDLVPDYFTRIRQDEFFGWPYVYLKPENVDPRIGPDHQQAAADRITRTRTPDVLFQAHSAALGLTFYNQGKFPEYYRNGAFAAFRGSWNRKPATGYKIVFIPFKDGRPTGAYEDFVTGFLLNDDSAQCWGRPVGVLVTPVGDLLFADDNGGRIFRVTYEPVTEAFAKDPNSDR
jgi:glucose/arabinose dehydrogenase